MKKEGECYVRGFSQRTWDNKIPEPEFLEERKDETISEKRLAQMIGLYRKKAEMLEKFQRGGTAYAK